MKTKYPPTNRTLKNVAAGILPAVEPGVTPGGKGLGNAEAPGESKPNPGGRMPPSTAGETPAATHALSRRAFVRRTAVATGAALAGPLILPSRVLGLGGEVAPSNRITIGFIGTGRQATYANIPGFLREPDAQAVAVCDVDSWRLAQAQKQIEDFYAKQKPAGSFKGCAGFHDWRDLLARQDIDAVMISTPDHWHVLMAIAAVKVGKDVACEKPLTRSIAEGRKLADLVAKEKKVFRTDSEFRSNKTFHRAAELVRNGRIGKLQRIITATPKDPTLAAQPDMPVPPELDYDMWLGPAAKVPYTEKRVHPPHETKGRPGWLCNRDYADGMLANWGAHLNDIALWANDSDRTGPVEIEGTGKYPPAGNLWNIIQEFEVHFTFANGVRLTCKTENLMCVSRARKAGLTLAILTTLQPSRNRCSRGSPDRTISSCRTRPARNVTFWTP